MDVEKLYNTYYKQVYSYVMTVIKDNHMADEITQEVFYKALRSMNLYLTEESKLKLK